MAKLAINILSFVALCGFFGEAIAVLYHFSK
jgi:hypothetical protein